MKSIILKNHKNKIFITLLILVISFIWTESIHYHQNTLLNSKLWKSNRVLNRIGADFNYLNARSIFANNRVNFDSMYAFVQIITKVKYTPRQIEFNYIGLNETSVEINFNRDELTHEGIQLSTRDGQPSVLYFKALNTGEYQAKSILSSKKIQRSGRVLIKNEGRNLKLRVNNEVFFLNNVNFRSGYIAFGGKSRPGSIDNFKLIDSSKNVFLDTFDSYENFQRSFLIHISAFFLFAIFVFFIFKNEFIVKKALLGIFAFSLFWTLYDHLYYSHKRTFWNGEFEISTYSPDSHLKYLELMGLKFFNIYSKALGFKVMNNITLDEEVAKLNFQKDGPIICSLRHKCRSSASIDKESINPNAYKIISYGGSLAMGLGLDHLEDTYILKSVKYLSPHLKQYDDIITYSITQGGDETDEKIKFLFDAYHKIKPNLLIFSTFHQPSESQLEKLLTIIYQALKNDVKVLFVQYLIFPKPTEDSSFVALDKKIIDQFKKYPNFSTYNPHSVDFNFIQNYFGKIWIDRVHLTVFGHQTLAKCLSKTLFKAVGVTNIASRNFLCDLYQKEENQ